jgi:hypothetical protein
MTVEIDGDWNWDDFVPESADEPVLLSLIRQMERGKITADQIMLIPGMGPEAALESIAYLEAKGVDCSEVFKEIRLRGDPKAWIAKK